jgi:hypothetical protein
MMLAVRTVIAVLVAAAAVHCRSSEGPTRAAGTDVVTGRTVPTPERDRVTNQVNRLAPRRTPAPVAIVGSRLVWMHEQQLESWDLKTRHRLDPIPLPEQTTVVAAGSGAVVVVARDRTKNTARLLRFTDAAQAPVQVDAEYGSAFSNAVAVWLDRAGRLYVGAHGGLDTYKVGAKVEIAAHVDWNSDQEATLVGTDDGVLFSEGGGLVRLGPGDQRSEFSSPIGSPIHLAAGPDREHVWASTEDAVSLLKLSGAAATVVATVPVAGVYHLASTGGDAVVLSVTMKGGAWDAVALIAIGADGKVRWSKPLPTPARIDPAVAGGPGYVAVVADDALTVFATADGAVVTP